MVIKDCCKSPYNFFKKKEATLNFEPITLDSVDIIYPFFREHKFRTCDFTIGGLYMWVDYFKYEYCIYEDTLFIKGSNEDDLQEKAFTLPIGKLPLIDSLCLLKDYCIRENIRLTLSAVPESGMEQIKELFVDAEISELENWSDYLYDSNSLATLVGHRYNKKRNRTNKFKREYPDYAYKRITPENIGQVNAFFKAYCEEYGKDNPLSQYENKMVSDILENYDRFDFPGGYIEVGGRIIAFTIGEVIGDTLYVHIEKAIYNYAGSYEMINMLFAQDIVENNNGVLCINREEDVGDPGLREAKMSYHPIELLAKYNVVI